MFGASEGLTLVQGAGRLEYADDTMYIHPVPDVLFGRVKGPVNVIPACISMMSPGFAELRAA
jgi:hypothetical protein